MSDNSRAMFEMWKNMGNADKDALFQLMKMMDRENIRTSMYLNQERMQYSLGKTEKALQFASQHYYGNYSNNDKFCFLSVGYYQCDFPLSLLKLIPTLFNAIFLCLYFQYALLKLTK